MILKSLYLSGFRNYKEAYIEFSPSLNLFIGNNGQGKSNLLEAIYFLITGRSFRTVHNTELIAYQESRFFLEASIVKNGISQKLQIDFSAKTKKIRHNHTFYTTLSHLLGLLQGTLLTALDTDLIRGAPCVRRQFLDVQLAQVDPLYVHHLKRYERALKQRNILLKRRQYQNLDLFEYELIKNAFVITQKREALIQELNKLSSGYQQLISSDKDHLTLHYQTQALSEDKAHFHSKYEELFAKSKSREISLGYTLTGPHKDDVKIKINEKEAKCYASEGQKNCAVAALKLSEWQRLKKTIQDQPLMCVDDIGLGLDDKRLSLFYRELTKLGQLFITTPKSLPFNIKDREYRLLTIESGQLLHHHF